MEDLIKDQVYLCEIWFTPPGFTECEKQEKQISLMKFNGYHATSPLVKTIRCGESTFELKYDGRSIPQWIVPEYSTLPSGPVYNIIPLRILAHGELVQEEVTVTIPAWGHNPT